MTRISSNNIPKIKKILFLVIFSISFLIGEEIAYKELELELDLESRFLSRLERIVGKDRVMLEVDITIEYKDVQSTDNKLSLRRVSGLPSRPAKLPGFARITQKASEKKKDKIYHLFDINFKTLLQYSKVAEFRRHKNYRRMGVTKI